MADEYHWACLSFVLSSPTLEEGGVSGLGSCFRSCRDACNTASAAVDPKSVGGEPARAGSDVRDAGAKASED